MKELLKKLAAGSSLSADETRQAIEAIISPGGLAVGDVAPERTAVRASSLRVSPLGDSFLGGPALADVGRRDSEACDPGACGGELAETTNRNSAGAGEANIKAVSEGEIGAFLFATATRPVVAEELVGASRALRAHMRAVPRSSLPPGPLLDTCGTGGSGLHGFNASTLSGLIVASAGIDVLKHGNRSVSSSCGSADILEAMGVPVHLPADEIPDAVRANHFAFLFAPNFHPATARVQLVRRALGLRTIFNFLGPLVHPAQVPFQVLGVSDAAAHRPMADALSILGVERAYVVRGDEGLDEFTPCGRTAVFEVTPDAVTAFAVSPEDFGFKPQTPIAYAGGRSVAEAKDIAFRLLRGEVVPQREFVLMNAAAAFRVCGKVSGWREGVELASSLIESGATLRLVESLSAPQRSA